MTEKETLFLILARLGPIRFVGSSMIIETRISSIEFSFDLAGRLIKVETPEDGNLRPVQVEDEDEDEIESAEMYLEEE
jgi:hypothetical protein